MKVVNIQNILNIASEILVKFRDMRAAYPISDDAPRAARKIACFSSKFFVIWRSSKK